MILFGNNVVNIAATAITTSLCITFFGDKWGVFLSTFVVSFVVLIFCEIFPKTVAIRNPNSIALFVAPIISFLTIILAPMLLFLNTLVKNIMRAFGLLRQEKLGGGEKTELRGAIEMHQSPEMKNETNMLKSVLDLSEVSVGDVMTYRNKIVSLDVSLPVEQLIEQVLTCPYTRVPLWKDKKTNIIGILHTKLLLRALHSHKGERKNFDIMTAVTQPWFVLETTSLLDQLQAYRRRHEHFAIVVDEYGVVQGIVTLEDILEEIVGDIMDETDHPNESQTLFIADTNGNITVDGSTSIRDLNRHFGWELPDEEASTIAGLLLYESERIPHKGASYSFYGFNFKVLDKKGNRITRILIVPPQKEKEE
jgi:Mg2+/Co2+ transporter CorB